MYFSIEWYVVWHCSISHSDFPWSVSVFNSVSLAWISFKWWVYFFFPLGVVIPHNFKWWVVILVLFWSVFVRVFFFSNNLQVLLLLNGMIHWHIYWEQPYKLSKDIHFYSFNHFCLVSNFYVQAFTGKDSTGALTYSFIQAVQNEPGLTYGRLLNSMRYAIREAKTGIRLNGPIASLVNRLLCMKLSQVLDLYLPHL